MANQCISFDDLPLASSLLAGDEIVPVLQSGSVRQTIVGNVANSAVQWSSDITYKEGFVVFDGDNYYVATADNTGNPPSDHNPAFWIPVLFATDTTLNVPSEFASITAVYAYIRQSEIANNATLTIQVADGAYSLGTTQISLNHPDGARIQLLGNVTTPASVTLGFTALSAPPTSPYLDSNSGSIYINDGHSFGFIDGFSIVRTGGVAAFGHCGILAYDASINVGANMVVTDFYYGFAAAANATFNVAGNGAASPILEPDTGGAAIYASASYIVSPYVEINGTQQGVVLVEGSEARLNNITTAAGLSTVFTISDSSLQIPSGTIGNATTFFSVTNEGYVSDTGATYGASTQDVTLLGSLQYNTSTALANGVFFDLSLLAAGTVQRILSSTTKVFLSATGVDTTATNLSLRAGGTVGLTVTNATGAVAAPVSMAVGATSAFIGLQGGTVTLNGSGEATVPASWLTANTVIVAAFDSTPFTPTGPFVGQTMLVGVSFLLASSAGAADAGAVVKWIAIVYP